jgi:pentatricopeptide repeat protein
MGNALIHACGKSKCVEGARYVFDDLVVRDVVTWNSLFLCYVNGVFPLQGLNEYFS